MYHPGADSRGRGAGAGDLGPLTRGFKVPKLSIFGPCLIFLYFYRPKRSWGKVIFLHLFVILFTGGRAWLLPGGMRGCSGGVRGCCGGACVVALGGMCGCSWGHAWLWWGVCMVAPGACMVAWGCVWLLQGGMHGFSQGACMVAPGGCVVAVGGMHGCSRGACMGYDKIWRYS